MKVKDVCEKYGLPDQIVQVLEKSGITTLYPPQVDAIKKGALSEKNLVLAVPTASGKTLVAEFCMLKSVLKGSGKCLYIVPLRALASEKYDEFKEKYGPLGVKVGISTGDFDVADPRLARYDILVATSEKVDSLLRHRAKWLADVISVVVLDEVHLIDDPGRGPTLEILTARLRQVNPKLQVLALSATIKNADEIAEWLGAELVKSEWRPVPLKKGVYHDEKIKFDDGSKRVVSTEVGDDLGALAIDTVREGGQALVFVSTRRSAQAAATLIAKYVRGTLATTEREQLAAVAKAVEGALGEPTRTCRQLADCVRQGVAFHHAGLHHAQRKAVEDAFRKNLIKVICATPTLAAGVNLPSRRTIIRDYRRYVEPYGLVFIPVLEFHQMAGRAGRPQYDEYGEAVVIAHSRREVEALFKEFIRAEPERITSKLATEPALRAHVLAAIAAGYVSDAGGLLEFMGHTFFAYQYSVGDVERVVQRVLDFLEREEMIRRQGELLLATPFGERVSRLYIDPLSAVVLRDGIKSIATKEPTELSLLHLICHTPDMGLLYLRRNDYSDLELIYLDHADELLTPIPDPQREPDRFEGLLAELKTAQMIQAWIDEVKEDDIHERFGIGAGDIRRSADTAEWLLYAAHELASLFKVRVALAPLRKLHERVRHGVREELLELVRLRGIGRVRGRSLFRAGYRKLADIERATQEELARVPYIGPEIAKSIKRQVEQEINNEKLSAT
ncbi:MAG: ATP-dependent DNA helicase [Candidatus Hodarchaeaceae archaeon]|nr:ATP-dependent DNA helicase [Candidatus Hodarchaeaceae archaeon]